ncbi:Fic family protein [Candidatus Saccharibacteria bacterium]|nr:Fic family protein [Candidatus Saccharibacteria bacterium]
MDINDTAALGDAMSLDIVDLSSYEPVLDDISPEQKRAYWQVAAGLQAVDGLEPSKYVQDLAKQHIEGKKTYNQVVQATDEYYARLAQSIATFDAGANEADVVTEAIYAILSNAAFRFDINTLKDYHKQLFSKLNPEIYHPGEFREVNLTKKEAVLNGKSVQYQDYGLIEQSLQYDFDEEQRVDYLALDPTARAWRMANFMSRIWQVHPFMEGNTRTCSVFIEKYLMSLGYQVDNEFFYHHAKDFRDALVLANYTSIPDGIQANPSKLYEYFEVLMRE